jgi:hypothetical protein
MTARVGGYKAPIDTTAMDPEMQKMFQQETQRHIMNGLAPAIHVPSWLAAIGNMLSGKGAPPPPQPQAPAAPPMSQAQADSIYNRYVR